MKNLFLAMAVMAFIIGAVHSGKIVNGNIKKGRALLQAFAQKTGFESTAPTFEWRYIPPHYGWKGKYKNHDFKISLLGTTEAINPAHLLEDFVVLIEVPRNGEPLKAQVEGIEKSRIARFIPGSKLTERELVNTMSSMCDAFAK